MSMAAHIWEDGDDPDEHARQRGDREGWTALSTPRRFGLRRSGRRHSATTGNQSMWSSCRRMRKCSRDGGLHYLVATRGPGACEGAPKKHWVNVATSRNTSASIRPSTKSKTLSHGVQGLALHEGG
jgi:hypothetical protein